MILKEIYILKGIQPLKVGSEPPNRVPLGPPPSMMSPTPSHQYTGSVKDFAANVNSYTAVAGRGSSSGDNMLAGGAMPRASQTSVLLPPAEGSSQTLTPSSSTSIPSYVNLYGTSSSQTLPDHPPVSLPHHSASAGPPPLSGFFRKT